MRLTSFVDMDVSFNHPKLNHPKSKFKNESAGNFLKVSGNQNPGKYLCCELVLTLWSMCQGWCMFVNDHLAQHRCKLAWYSQNQGHQTPDKNVQHMQIGFPGGAVCASQNLKYSTLACMYPSLSLLRLITAVEPRAWTGFVDRFSKSISGMCLLVLTPQSAKCQHLCGISLHQVELKAMADRVLAMRACLHAAMIEKNAPGDWSFILKQIGMFSYTGGLIAGMLERVCGD